MIKNLPFSRSLLALSFAMTASAASAADIEFHRLAWDKDPAHQATIGFNFTDDSITPFVKYGFSTDENTWQEAAVDSTEIFKDARFTSHFVRLKNLPANAGVYYRVCLPSSCSDPLWFKTAPDDNSAFTMIAGGDTRTNWDTRRAGFELVAKIRPLFIMHGGDYTGSNSWRRMKDYFTDWALTFSDDTIDGIAYKRIYPVVPTHGNHEDDNYQTLCQVYGTDFNDDGVCTTDDTYGAFNVSPLLRAYTLNTQYQESGWSAEAAEQNTWLKNDLETNGSSTSWRFAQFHKSVFPHYSGKDENTGLFTWWADIFYDNSLNLVVESDTHINKMTKAVKPNNGTYEVADGGTVFVGEGSWGADARSADKSYPWTVDMASIQQFKVLTVSESNINLRTAQFDAGASTLSLTDRENDPLALPTGVNWWSAQDIGEVLTLSRDSNNRSVLGEGDGSSGGGGTTPPPTSADIELDAVADTFISQKLADNNFNSATQKLVADGADATYGTSNILMAWDVSSISNCNTITSASLQFQITNPSSGAYNIYQGLNAWAETDASWNNVFGQDHNGTLIGSVTPDVKEVRNVTLASEGIALVQSWLSDASNNGIVISSAGTSDGTDILSREISPAPKLLLNLDESSCYGPAEISNGSFENGESPWIYTLASRVNSDANEGSYAAEIQAGGDVRTIVTGLKPNTSYKATVKVKTSGQVQLFVSDYGSDPLKNGTTSATYRTKAVTFTTGVNNTSAEIYAYGVSGISHADSFALTEL